MQKMVWPLKRKEKEKLSRCVVAGERCVLMRQGGGVLRVACVDEAGWRCEQS